MYKYIYILYLIHIFCLLIVAFCMFYHAQGNQGGESVRARAVCDPAQRGHRREGEGVAEGKGGKGIAEGCWNLYIHVHTYIYIYIYI